MNVDDSPPVPEDRPAGAWPHDRGTWAIALAVAAMLAFAAPLFIGLDRWDLRNDESIYSYAVQRILETGDWLTPRSIPTDLPFLEKPPLKFWIVAGAMALGLTPNDEFGMRVFDAAFGALAFGYVLAFGWRLAGPLAGAIALLVLFSINPIIFDHSIRSNNMEAALILAYCGGLYHVFRWSEAADRRMRRVHAGVVAGYFFLGFMTKFVAVVFLPLVALSWLAMQPGGARRLLATWTDWVWPAVATGVLIAPWFVYQSIQSVQAEESLWQVIFGAHVYTRFTASLDPAHLEPWHFYFTTLWKELGYGESLVVGAAGLVLLGWRALRGHALAQLLLLWWFVPFAAISLGTSKLFHYAYPFLPPVGLGAGWLCVLAIRAVAARGSVAVDWRLERTRAVAITRARPRLRAALLVLAIACLGLSMWTLVTGEPLTLEAAGVRWFRNSSVVRPAILAMAMLLVSGHVKDTMRIVALALLLLVLPIPVYQEKVRRLSLVDRPLGAMRDCMLDLPASAGGGMYIAAVDAVTHQYYFYFRHAGPWATGPEGWEAEVIRRVSDASSPVVVTDAQWDAVRPALVPAGSADEVRPPDVAAVLVEPERGVLLVMPGAYAACEASVLASGALPYPSDDVR